MIHPTAPAIVRKSQIATTTSEETWGRKVAMLNFSEKWSGSFSQARPLPKKGIGPGPFFLAPRTS
jgi:hypothetical protein